MVLIERRGGGGVCLVPDRSVAGSAERMDVGWSICFDMAAAAATLA